MGSGARMWGWGGQDHSVPNPVCPSDSQIAPELLMAPQLPAPRPGQRPRKDELRPAPGTFL